MLLYSFCKVILSAVPKKLILYNQYTKQGISNYRIFATLLCMKHILFSDKHWNYFVDEIELSQWDFLKIGKTY